MSIAFPKFCKTALLVLLALQFLCPGVQAQMPRRLQTVPSTGPLAGQEIYSDSFALLVGISKYADKRIEGLTYADKDASDMCDILVKYYGFSRDHIVVLVNEQATLQRIQTELARLTDRERIHSNDRILIYFSGHGQTVSLPTGGDMGFLIPYDGSVDPNDLENPAPYNLTCLPMNLVWNYLVSSPANHSLVVADSCYSGLMAQPRALMRVPDPTLWGRRAMQVLTAGRKGEESWEDPNLGHGVFTYKLLEELKARALETGNVFTTSALFADLQESVNKSSLGKQNPFMGNYNTEGEFLFMPTPPVDDDKSGAAKEFDIGNSAYNIHNYDVALAHFQTAVQLAENNGYYHHMLGRVLHDLGRFSEAEASMRKAVQLDPTNERYQYWLADVFQHQKKYDEAEAQFLSALRLNPKDASSLDALAAVYRNTKRYDKAVDCDRQAVALSPDDAYYHFSLGLSLHEETQYEMAEQELREAVRLDTSQAYYNYWLGDMLRHQKKYDEALNSFDTAAKLAHDGSYLDDVGGIYYSEGKYPQAEESYRKFLNWHAENDRALNMLGNCLYADKKYAEAEEEYRAAIRVDAKDWNYHANLAATLYSEGRKDEAIAEAKEAQNLGGQDHWIFKTLGLTGNNEA